MSPTSNSPVRVALNAFAIFEGSDRDATTGLYLHLQSLGPIGIVALNLFRAAKCSTRAKEYHRRAHRANAYDRKQWSMDNLCKVLGEHAAALGIRYGWKPDPTQEFHNWVLYVDLPVEIKPADGVIFSGTHQVSFHTSHRGAGPDYPGDWDEVRDASAQRIVAFTQRILEQNSIIAP